jgi:hypothetical protein
MHILEMEDAKWELRMRYKLYAKTHQPALITFLLQQDDYLRVSLNFCAVVQHDVD